MSLGIVCTSRSVSHHVEERRAAVKDCKRTCDTSRRSLALAAIVNVSILPARAWALSAEEAAKRKEERRAALRAAANAAKQQELEVEASAQTGAPRKSVQDIGSVFGESEYSVGEDHSPNSHSHQEEGAKSAKGFY